MLNKYKLWTFLRCFFWYDGKRKKGKMQKGGVQKKNVEKKIQKRKESYLNDQYFIMNDQYFLWNSLIFSKKNSESKF